MKKSVHDRKETILLVEDEDSMRKFLAAQLRAEGHHALLAANGEAALSMSEKYPEPIHLLITDVMMPVMNGKELADRLCTLRPDIKVLFISGYRREDIFPDDVCEERNDWLPKPFAGSDFLRKVKEMLNPLHRK